MQRPYYYNKIMLFLLLLKQFYCFILQEHPQGIDSLKSPNGNIKAAQGCNDDHQVSRPVPVCYQAYTSHKSECRHKTYKQRQAQAKDGEYHSGDFFIAYKSPGKMESKEDCHCTNQSKHSESYVYHSDYGDVLFHF